MSFLIKTERKSDSFLIRYFIALFRLSLLSFWALCPR